MEDFTSHHDTEEELSQLFEHLLSVQLQVFSHLRGMSNLFAVEEAWFDYAREKLEAIRKQRDTPPGSNKHLVKADARALVFPPGIANEEPPLFDVDTLVTMLENDAQDGSYSEGIRCYAHRVAEQIQNGEFDMP